MLDPRAQLLRAALGFSTAPCPRMTESCTRLAHLAGLVGRDRARHRGDAPCFDLQLTQYDEKGWRATFYTTGMEHSPTSATGLRLGAHAVPSGEASHPRRTPAQGCLTTLIRQV